MSCQLMKIYWAKRKQTKSHISLITLCPSILLYYNNKQAQEAWEFPDPPQVNYLTKCHRQIHIEQVWDIDVENASVEFQDSEISIFKTL